VAVSIAPICGADGKVNGTMVTIADIRPRKLAEAALRESEAHLRLAMEPRRWGCGTGNAIPTVSRIPRASPSSFGYPADSPHTDYRVLQERLHPTIARSSRRRCATP